VAPQESGGRVAPSHDDTIKAKGDITDITETYSEFTIDAKADAKLFELPK
jgi:hypothetical protein